LAVVEFLQLALGQSVVAYSSSGDHSVDLVVELLGELDFAVELMAPFLLVLIPTHPLLAHFESSVERKKCYCLMFKLKINL